MMSPDENKLQAIRYSRGQLHVLDQLRLPHEFHYDAVSTREEAFDCIKAMRVRGAPAIAIVATLALAVELHNGVCSEPTHPVLGPFSGQLSGQFSGLMPSVLLSG
jgi:methylthioribose-1-phosphate isomerase